MSTGSMRMVMSATRSELEVIETSVGRKRVSGFGKKVVRF